MKKLNRLKIFYQQHILPIVYDYSMSLSEVVQRLVKVVNNLVDEVGDIEDKTGVYDDKIAALESKSADQAIYNEHINAEIEEINNTISELPTYDVIEDIRTDITNINSSIADLDTRVTVLEGQNIYQRLETAEQNIANLGSDVDALELDVSNIHMNISTIENDISDIQDDITNINGEITTINEDMSDMLDDITDIQGDVTTIRDNITNIQDDISDLQTAVLGKSTVSFNQIQTSGNKIGEITIDGVTIGIYAPSSSISTIDADHVIFDPDLTPYTSTNVQDALEELGDLIDFNYSVQFPNICCAGYITASNKDIYFLIPYNKICKRSIQAPVSPLRGNIYVRGVNGYIAQNIALNSYELNSSIAGTYCQITQTVSGVFIRLHNESGFNNTGPTNTPVSVYLNNLSLYRV